MVKRKIQSKIIWSIVYTEHQCVYFKLNQNISQKHLRIAFVDCRFSNLFVYVDFANIFVVDCRKFSKSYRINMVISLREAILINHEV